MYVDEELVRALLRDGLRSIPRELEFGRVRVFCDDECFH